MYRLSSVSRSCYLWPPSVLMLTSWPPTLASMAADYPDILSHHSCPVQIRWGTRQYSRHPASTDPIISFVFQTLEYPNNPVSLYLFASSNSAIFPFLVLRLS
ncbi:uncharacterized protein EI90DRAFT_290734 [Cantharellus anzutake]|uniref:uncharacterized protein n=1 Tax=Cantharellus anzutake TaxID=1750568 RepID=UPI001907B1AC|nr:uncharacterized protein EI90DRAFT_290734 [Cantharellus anzutake]KAF8316219.1 hypothetical protein EI90DRAFT_290734 [Cantharellus anzutake]